MSAKTEICIGYRSRNGFGGYVREMAEYKGGNDLTAEPLFSRCPGIQTDGKKSWTDITDEYRKAASAAPSKN